MLLLGKPVVESLKNEVKEFVEKNTLQGKKVTFFLLSEDKASQVYVNMKKQFAEEVGLVGEVIEQPKCPKEYIIENIKKRNQDDECLGMIVQLPLAEHLQPYQSEILGTIKTEKDLDGLSGVQFGRTNLGVGNFLPATAKAVVEILDYYEFGDLVGKEVMVIGQSNLVGKPFAVAAMQRGATVHSFNSASDQKLMRQQFMQSDIVVSATGVVNLVDESFVVELDEDTESSFKPLSEKVLIDVGWGIQEGKAVGDIDQEFYSERVKAITPVPGGVGPVTVASLFHNIVVLDRLA